MAEIKKATGIPEPLKAKYENIAGMIDAFCEVNLDGDYQYLHCIWGSDPNVVQLRSN